MNIPILTAIALSVTALWVVAVLYRLSLAGIVLEGDPSPIQPVTATIVVELCRMLFGGAPMSAICLIGLVLLLAGELMIPILFGCLVASAFGYVHGFLLRDSAIPGLIGEVAVVLWAIILL